MAINIYIIEKNVLIAGSVGPYGACQADGSEYHGKYIEEVSENFLIDWHRPRIEVLIKEGIDLLAVETIPVLEEAVAIIKLIKQYPPTKFWLTFSCKVVYVIY